MPKADDTTTDTPVGEDTSVAETSTEEETSEEPDNLEDIEVTPEELGEGDEEAKEPEDEKTDTEPEESKEESKEDVTEAEEPEEQSKAESAETQPEEQLSGAARRIQEKQQRAEAIRKQQQEYLAQADPDKPEDLALRQLQIDSYNNKVDANTNKLTHGYQQAIKDFDILVSDDPAVKAEVDAAIDAFQAMYVTVDAYGNPVEVRGDMYAYLQSKADSIARLTGIRAKNQKTSKDKEKSKTFTTPSKAPKELKADVMIDAFDEEAAKP